MKKTWNYSPNSAVAAVFIVLVVIVLFLMIPFALIWAVNTLFGTGIAYNFSTWLATIILTGAISSNPLLKLDFNN